MLARTDTETKKSPKKIHTNTSIFQQPYIYDTDKYGKSLASKPAKHKKGIIHKTLTMCFSSPSDVTYYCTHDFVLA